MRRLSKYSPAKSFGIVVVTVLWLLPIGLLCYFFLNDIRPPDRVAVMGTMDAPPPLEALLALDAPESFRTMPSSARYYYSWRDKRYSSEQLCADPRWKRMDNSPFPAGSQQIVCLRPENPQDAVLIPDLPVDNEDRITWLMLICMIAVVYVEAYFNLFEGSRKLTSLFTLFIMAALLLECHTAIENILPGVRRATMAHWEKTPCNILRSSLVFCHYDQTSSVPLDRRNRWVIAVSRLYLPGFCYEKNGKTYYSATLGVDPLEKPDVWLQEYPVDSQRFCWVNPRNPAQAVLQRPAPVNWLNFLLAQGMAGILLTVAGSILIYRNRCQKNAAPWKRP